MKAKNWKTTLAGIVTGIAAAATYLWPQYAAMVTTIMGLAASVGLIAAPDAEKE